MAAINSLSPFSEVLDTTTLFIEELDVCSDTSVAELVDKLIAKEGQIDVLGKKDKLIRQINYFKGNRKRLSILTRRT